ncbi:MAG TPA: DUF4198 domain-containing protein [Caulobacteraceae bacterium]|nr:DUF4198 domain-containing protein [Caulobacteraceae bacterium]
MRDHADTLKRALAGAFACLAAPSAALAHDVWVVARQQDGGTVALIRYADPAKLELAERGKVVSLEVISPGGKINLKRPLAPAKSGPALESKPFTAPQASILSVVYDNGFWTESAEDGVETNTSKLLTPNHKQSWWAPKFGKTLLGPGSYAVRTHSMLELVPLSDPYATPVGKTLAVRLEGDGKPVAGVKVVYGDGVEAIPEAAMPSVTTDKDGVAQIPVTRRGAYLLAVHRVGPPSQPALADADDVYVTLAFDTSKEIPPPGGERAVRAP